MNYKQDKKPVRSDWNWRDPEWWITPHSFFTVWRLLVVLAVLVLAVVLARAEEPIKIDSQNIMSVPITDVCIDSVKVWLDKKYIGTYISLPPIYVAVRINGEWIELRSIVDSLPPMYNSIYDSIFVPLKSKKLAICQTVCGICGHCIPEHFSFDIWVCKENPDKFRTFHFEFIGCDSIEWGYFLTIRKDHLIKKEDK